LKNFYKIPPHLPLPVFDRKKITEERREKNTIFIKGIPPFPSFLKGGEGGFLNRLN